MRRQELIDILHTLPRLRILVVGDFFLDQYLYIDPEKDEISRETGLTAYQVVRSRLAPGAAGTVVNNLKALGVGTVYTLGIIGDDGNGFELERCLKRIGANTEPLIVAITRVTPTYTKPMRGSGGSYVELNRLDIKNWAATPDSLQRAVVEKLHELSTEVDAILVSDQVEETGCGVIAPLVRDALMSIGRRASAPIVMVDSRAHAGLFRDVILKPNENEALRAIRLLSQELQMDPAQMEDKDIMEVGRRLARHTGRPVFLTRGEKGQLVFDGDKVLEVPAIKVSGPIDIVGAGDATMAGIAVGLCCGLPPGEAAFLGNIVASITVQKIGETGTASPHEVLDRYDSLSVRQAT